MLEIHPIMNSAVEEIFGFKTCCGLRAFDQNLGGFPSQNVCSIAIVGRS